MQNVNNTRLDRVTKAFVWARHMPSTAFCEVVGANDAGRTHTSCRGSWPAGDVVEVADAPPQDARCDECLRVAIERKEVENGLAELVSQAPADLEHRFDHGGES